MTRDEERYFEEMEQMRESCENRVQRVTNQLSRERAIKEHLVKVLKLREREILGLKAAAKRKDAEITRLRKKLVAISEFMEDILDSEEDGDAVLKDCRMVLIRVTDDINSD